MVFEFKLPDIGEGVVEGEIVTWHRKEGEFVQEDDPLIEVMTDKATVTIPSPKSGVVTKRCFMEGDVAPVGEILVFIDPEGDAGGVPAEIPTEQIETPAPPPPTAPTPPAPAAPAPVAPPVAVAPIPVADPATPKRRVLAAPATRKIARDMGIDIQQVPGTGAAGRVTRDDVLSFIHTNSPQIAQPVQPAAPVATPAVAAQPAISAPVATPPAQPAVAPVVVQGSVERVPIRGLRKRIFERMAESKHTAAHFTYVDEVDMTRLVDTRSRLKDRAKELGANLTFLPFFMKAAYLGLKDYPHLNANMDDEQRELLVHGSYHFSIAVATDAGLTVPVVHDVNTKSIFELAQNLGDLSDRARSGQLRREDFAGGTFTITSLGKLGGMFATPIVNYPEVAIIGIHAIEDRPVVVDGEIVIRKMMYLSGSFDHRIVDGHIGAAFINRVKRMLEDPDALLLELR